jgi:hypothetical protein
MSVGGGVVVAGGAVGGVDELDGAGAGTGVDDGFAPGSAVLGLVVWLGGVCIGPAVPPVPGVWLGTSGALVSSIGGGGVVVGFGADGAAASGRTGTGSGVGGSRVVAPGSLPMPAPLPDESIGERPLLPVAFGRGGGTVSSAPGLPGGSSSEPGAGFGDGLPGVPGACASRIPSQAGAAVARAFTV